ncbi:MAG: hypothetical protein HF312_15605 [Ignavibacteria bacterium]|jgi:predicted PolB exonuclease-like 3'-5' exonuclease|nr:hypothetical protein [Ignavibacteria bacterium]
MTSNEYADQLWNRVLKKSYLQWVPNSVYIKFIKKQIAKIIYQAVVEERQRCVAYIRDEAEYKHSMARCSDPLSKFAEQNASHELDRLADRIEDGLD